jgi:hypothetical protein
MTADKPSPSVTAQYVQAALETQGVQRDLPDLAGSTVAVGLMLKAAGRGFATLAFEAEPANFAAEQRRSAP